MIPTIDMLNIWKNANEIEFSISYKNYSSLSQNRVFFSNVRQKFFMIEFEFSYVKQKAQWHYWFIFKKWVFC